MGWKKCERPIAVEQQEELKKIFGPNFEHCDIQMKVKMRTKRNWKKVWERNKYVVYGIVTSIFIAIVFYVLIKFYH